MAIKILPEHEAYTPKQPVAKKTSGRISIRPEDQAILDGTYKAPTPVQKPTPAPEPSILDKAKTLINDATTKVENYPLKKKAESLYDKIFLPDTSGAMKFNVGEGLTPEEKAKADEVLKKDYSNEPQQRYVKVPFIDRAFELPTGGSTDIKIPFTDKKINVPLPNFGYDNQPEKNIDLTPAGIGSTILKAAEAPEKIYKTLKELKQGTIFSEQPKEDTAYKAPSYGEVSSDIATHFYEKGYPYSASVLLGTALGTLNFVGDASVFAGFLYKGAGKVAGDIPGSLTANEIRTAHEFLGNPKTLAEAEANWRGIQKQFHPDLNGGNDIISKQANQAIAILRKSGIPTEKDFAGIVDNRPTKKVEVKQIGDGTKPVVEKPTPAPVQPVVETPTQPIVEKPVEKSNTINIKAENIAETAKKEGLDYNPQTQIKLGTGEIVNRPEAIVSRTQLQGLLKTLQQDEIILDVGEAPKMEKKSYYSNEYVPTGEQEKTLIYREPGKREITIKASALGLRTDKLPVGGKVKITSKALGIKGSAKETAFRGVDDEGNVVAKEFTQPRDLPVAKTPEELKQRIEQLNKFAQQQSILRKAGGLKKNRAGVFMRGRDLPKEGQVRLRKETLLNDRDYMSTLAHELGHALENAITGTTNAMTQRVFGKNLTASEWKTIREELVKVTEDIEGVEAVKARPQYFLQNTELLARFMQKHFESPGNLNDLAPTAVEYLRRSAMENPVIEKYFEAVEGTIDAGQRRGNALTKMFNDMRETYQDALGKRVGDMAFEQELNYRRMRELSVYSYEKFLKEKFKNVKDSPEALFDAAEGIKVTKNGEPEYGTRIFAEVDDLAEAKALEGEGFEVIRDSNGDPVMEYVDGQAKIRIAKYRFTPEQAKANFEKLSPEGKQLVKDYTAALSEAKDYFNRELIKDVNKIEGNIEGWVHHFWDEDMRPSGIGANKFKNKIASSRKQRTGQSGYIKDLQEATKRAMVNLQQEKDYNNFIGKFLATVTRAYAKGMDIPKGWIVVEGDLAKGGIAREGQNKFKILKEDGEMITGAKSKYIMPEEVYQRYEMIKGVTQEASDIAKAFNSLNRYWKVNILFHPGSAATNLFSGGIQYSTKVMTDFYEELLTGNVAMPQTRKNVEAMFKAFSPKGWMDAPDWIYGGHMSNSYGQFSIENAPGINVTKLDKGVDFYGDRVLKLYGAVERYWKRVIVLAEGGGDLKNLSNVTKRGLKELSQEEKDILARINKEVDLYAYDYDNVPVWLEQWSKGKLGSAVFPFAKYPYKMTKHFAQLTGRVFDRTLPWQERVSGLLALSTLMGSYAYFRENQKEKQESPEVPESAPTSVSTRGRLYVYTDKDGKEVFTRVSKYPFVNLTEAGLQLTEGNINQSWQSIQDMTGSFGPVAEAFLAVKGYSSEYNQNATLAARMGKLGASYLPGTRILSDIAKYFDPYQRTQKTFVQGIGSVLPIPESDPEVMEKLRGPVKTINVPIEGSIQNTNEEGSRRTTITRLVENYKQDILLALLLGIYQIRIDPREAEAFVERKAKNDEKKANKEN